MFEQRERERESRRGWLRWKMSWRERRLAPCWRCIMLQALVRSMRKCCCHLSDFYSPAVVGWSDWGDITCRASIVATWAQTVESQDVSLRGTIDPILSVGGKPGRANHIRPPEKCHMLRDFLNNTSYGSDVKSKKVYHNINIFILTSYWPAEFLSCCCFCLLFFCFIYSVKRFAEL